MDFKYLDKKEYEKIPMIKMIDNKHGGLRFYIRKYNVNKTDSDECKTWHRHEFIQINYVYKGKGKHFINAHEFDIIKGDIFVIPPYIPHRLSGGESDVEIYEFEFEPGFINQAFEDDKKEMDAIIDFAYIEPFLVSENKVKPRLNLVGGGQVETEGILNEALKEYTERKTGFKLCVKSLLLKLLVITGRAYSNEKSEDGTVFNYHKEAINKAIKYIDEKYIEDITMNDLTKVSMLSQSYFCFLFKSITGRTFKDYLNTVRVSKAKELLINTNMKVYEICYEAGFNSVTHFYRIFKKYTQMTPYDYRKQLN